MTPPPSTDSQSISFLRDFYVECDEHFAALRRALLPFEHDVCEPSRAVLDELFRSFHTIKGLAGMVELDTAEALAHELESYLKALRARQIDTTRQGLDALIAGVQALEEVVAAHQAKRAPASISAALDALRAVSSPPEDSSGDSSGPSAAELGAQANVDTKRMAGNGARVPARSDSPASEARGAQQEKLRAALDSGKKIWISCFTPTPQRAARGVNVNAIRAGIAAVGDIVEVSPKLHDGGNISFEFIWVTQDESPPRIDDVEHAAYNGSVANATAQKGEAPTGDAGPSAEAGAQVQEPAGAGVHRAMGPSSSVVRVELPRLDALVHVTGELVISRARLKDEIERLGRLVTRAELRPLQEGMAALERQLRALRDGVMRLRLVPIAEIFERMPFAVRDIAREAGKDVQLELSGRTTEIDKYLVERLLDPLLHLARNAVSHGVETPAERRAAGKAERARISLRAVAAGESVCIEVEDDGRGIDVGQVAERAAALGMNHARNRLADPQVLLDVLCSPGFTTREHADRASGRGVGMDVVRRAVQELNGTLKLDTRLGRGTTFSLQLPLTLAITDALITEVRGERYAVPQAAVHEVIAVEQRMVQRVETNEVVRYRDGVLPLVRLERAFSLPCGEARRHFHALVVGKDRSAAGIAVDRVIGQREIVVRPFNNPMIKVPGIAGATELGDGQAVLILDPAAISRSFAQAGAAPSR